MLDESGHVCLYLNFWSEDKGKHSGKQRMHANAGMNYLGWHSHKTPEISVTHGKTLITITA